MNLSLILSKSGRFVKGKTEKPEKKRRAGRRRAKGTGIARGRGATPAEKAQNVKFFEQK